MNIRKILSKIIVIGSRFHGRLELEMNAKEARKISDKTRLNGIELQNILQKIKESAEDGELRLTVFGITPKTQKALEELGYSVWKTCHYNTYGDHSYTISWED